MPPAADGAPPVIVVMGVSGAGKTTVGRALAARLGWIYRDADAFHSQANIDKMHAGHPLDDADRMPWLAAIGDWMDACARAGDAAVIGCSALKRRYRDALRDGRPQVWFVYLRVPREELEQRLQERRHHFMPASLVDSQLATLEEPQPGEPGTSTLKADADVAGVVDSTLLALRRVGLLQDA